VGRTLSLTAAGLGVAAVTESLIRYVPGASSTQFVLVACLLAAATALPLAVGRPTVAAAATVAAGVWSLVVAGTVPVAGAVAQLAAAYRTGRAGSAPIAVGLGLPYLALAFMEPAGYPRATAIVLTALAPAAALAGLARRISQETVTGAATRRALASTLVEHTARGERARIARELHDVVAHHISMIAVQAETARLTTAGMPAVGAQRLSAIGDTARDALTEMRRLLGVLRADANPVERQPQPGLRQLNDLLDEAREASGSGTRLILRGAPVPVDPGVELAAYRIVQEALTNARRHAAGAAVDVELHFDGPALLLSIRDNGPGATGPAGDGGLGLLGMSERAAAVGGTLRAGPASGGGFLVRVRLPAKGAGDLEVGLPAKGRAK
jgi:signal transduction histidine kinase